MWLVAYCFVRMSLEEARQVEESRVKTSFVVALWFLYALALISFGFHCVQEVLILLFAAIIYNDLFSL